MVYNCEGVGFGLIARVGVEIDTDVKYSVRGLGVEIDFGL